MNMMLDRKEANLKSFEEALTPRTIGRGVLMWGRKTSLFDGAVLVLG